VGNALQASVEKQILKIFISIKAQKVFLISKAVY
jgi:hypothetical protein